MAYQENSKYNYQPPVDDTYDQSTPQQLQQPILQQEIRLPNKVFQAEEYKNRFQQYDSERMPQISLYIQCPKCRNGVTTLIMKKSFCKILQPIFCCLGYMFCCFPCFVKCYYKAHCCTQCGQVVGIIR